MAMIKTHMTAKDYQQLFESSQPNELINGEVVPYPLLSAEHQAIILRLTHRLITITPKNARVLTTPHIIDFDMLNVIQPDVFVIMNENSLCHSDKKGYFHGAPELVCEMLSFATAVRDRREKFSLYEK